MLSLDFPRADVFLLFYVRLSHHIKKILDNLMPSITSSSTVAERPRDASWNGSQHAMTAYWHRFITAYD